MSKKIIDRRRKMKLPNPFFPYPIPTNPNPFDDFDEEED